MGQGISPLNALSDACRGLAHFRLVYIAEAHASDEWPVGHPFDVPQHTTNEERASAAARFRDEFGLRTPLFIAPIHGAFEEHYRPWPFRFFVIENGRIALSPKPIGEVYDIGELWEYLDMKKEVQTQVRGADF